MTFVNKLAKLFRARAKTQSVKVNYIYNLIYKVLALLIPLITTPYLTGILSASGIGEISYINTYSNYFVLFANLGFNYYAQRLISTSRNDKHLRSKFFFETVIARFVTTIISISIYATLASFSAFGKQYDLLVWIYIIPIFSVMFDFTFYLTGIENFRTIVLRDALIKIFGTACIFIFVKNANHVWIYGLILSLTSLVSALSVAPSLYKEVERVNLREIRIFAHLKKSFVLFLPLAASSVYPYIDKTIIGLFVNDAEVGCYAKAEQISSTAAAFVTSLGIVISPRNSLLFSEGKEEELKQSIGEAMRFIWMIGIPICLGLIAIAPMMLGWYIKGEGFGNFRAVLSILAVTIGTLGFRNVLGVQYLIPAKRDKAFAICILAGLLVNIGLSAALAFVFKNSVGVALATVVSELVICVFLFFVARKTISAKLLFATIWKYVISGALMFGACFLLCFVLEATLVNTLLIIGVGAGVYFLGLYLLRDSMMLDLLSRGLSICEKILVSPLYSKVVSIAFCGVIFLSIVSYSPLLLSISLNKLIFVFWFTLTILSIPLAIHRVRNIFIALAFVYIPFVLFNIVSSLITKEMFISSVFTRLILISGYLFLNGYLISPIVDRTFVRKVSYAIFFASLLASINIFLVYFRGFSFSEKIYRYSGKNEISCFVLIAICLVSFLKQKKVLLQVFMIAAAGFMLLLLGMMKSRAVLIVIPFIFIVELFNKQFQLKARLLTLGAVATLVLLVFVIPPLRTLIIDDILFASHNPADINDISSNRLVLINEALEVFKLSPLIGVGSYYVDFGFVEILTSFGICGFVLLLPSLLLPLYCLVKNKRVPAFFRRILLLLIIVYYFNHFFEAYPPYGPGIKTCLIWVFSGMAFGFGNESRIFLASQYRLRIKTLKLEI